MAQAPAPVHSAREYRLAVDVASKRPLIGDVIAVKQRCSASLMLEKDCRNKEGEGLALSTPQLVKFAMRSSACGAHNIFEAIMPAFTVHLEQTWWYVPCHTCMTSNSSMLYQAMRLAVLVDTNFFSFHVVDILIAPQKAIFTT